MFKEKKSLFYFFIFLWGTFVIYYAMSMKFNFYREFSDTMVFIVQIIFDVFIGFFSFLSIFNNENKKEKIFYFIFFLSVIFGLITNESFNVLVNILKHNPQTSSSSFLWEYPYTLFLVLNVSTWFYLFNITNKKKKIKKTNKMITFSYLQACIIVAISFVLSKPFRELFLENGFFNIEVINTLLELFLFGSITMALSKTKNNALIWIEVGFLLLISLNLAQRAIYLSGSNYYKIFDVFWMICLFIIAYGFFRKSKFEKNTIDFFEFNSIHTITGAIFSVFSSCIFIIFIILNLLISSLNTLSATNNMPFYKNISGILIFSYLFSILTSKIISFYASKPLSIISSQFNEISENKRHETEIEEKNIFIYEVDQMYKCLLDTILQLKTANQIKSTFIMNMSHDFKTPATGIHFMSKHIYKKMNDKKLKKFQELVVNSSEELIRLIDDILEYSQLTQKQISKNSIECDIKSLICDLLRFMSPKIHEKNLKINFLFYGNKKLYYTDPTLMNRIILNLLSNAIKFTNNGTVTITVTEELFNNLLNLKISIKDTGIGIDKKYHQLIFEPFFRVESMDTRAYSGVGLGLSHVKLMIGKLSGSILVESSLSEGTNFVILIPISTNNVAT